jgi:chromosomal replication initiation ATPase DnaA
VKTRPQSEHLCFFLDHRFQFLGPDVTEVLVRDALEAIAQRTFAVQFTPHIRPARGGTHVVFARRVAMYLGHIALGLNFTDVARLFGRHRTTAAQACGLIEDARDDVVLDRTLELLEAAVRMAVLRQQPAGTDGTRC